MEPLRLEGGRAYHRVKYHDDSARAASAAEQDFQFLRALRATGCRFENVSARVLSTESRLALPPKPIEVPIGSAAGLAVDSPLSGI
jgi:hypothetical protein